MDPWWELAGPWVRGDGEDRSGREQSEAMAATRLGAANEQADEDRAQQKRGRDPGRARGACGTRGARRSERRIRLRAAVLRAATRDVAGRRARGPLGDGARGLDEDGGDRERALIVRDMQRHDRCRIAGCRRRCDLRCGQARGRRHRIRVDGRRSLGLAHRGHDGRVGVPDRRWSLNRLCHDIDDRARVGCDGRRVGGLSGGGDGGARRRRRLTGGSSARGRSSSRSDGGRGRRCGRRGGESGCVGGGGWCLCLLRCGRSGCRRGWGWWLWWRCGEGRGRGLRGGGRGRWLRGGSRGRGLRGGRRCLGGGRGRCLGGGGRWLLRSGGCGRWRLLRRGGGRLGLHGGWSGGQRRWRDDRPAEAGADQGRHGLHARARSVRSKQHRSSHQAPSRTARPEHRSEIRRTDKRPVSQETVGSPAYATPPCVRQVRCVGATSA
jgi:hypothetical protein